MADSDSTNDVTAAAQAVAREPGSALAQHRLGLALAAQGRADEALFRFRRAAALDEALAAPLVESGRLLAAMGRLTEAETALRTALSREASHEAQLGLGTVLSGMGRLEEALEPFAAVPPSDPNYADAQLKLGAALQNLARADAALAVFEPLIVADRSNIAAHLGAANALRALGRKEAAQNAYETALALAPEVPTLHRGVAEGKTFRPGDPQIAQMEALLQTPQRYPVNERIGLAFAAAKAYDDVGEPDRAFALWRLGNDLKRRTLVYDEAATLGQLRRIEQAFSAELIATHQGQGDPSERPIFIVGMPRSGTTLVEQILASHPAVHGAGEQRHLSDLIEAGQAGPRFPESIATLSADDWQRLGAGYIDRLPTDKPRVTDKLPANFRNIGLIHLALPKARILHVTRDPMDTCFSCYSHLFPHGLEYTNDLGELARYYRGYDALMAHWRRVLPPGAMLEIAYEDLVADLESRARRILAYCGLDWDARCLAFHQTERAIYTVSVDQVRTPLYASSVGRWRAYEKQLAGLQAALP